MNKLYRLGTIGLAASISGCATSPVYELDARDFVTTKSVVGDNPLVDSQHTVMEKGPTVTNYTVTTLDGNIIALQDRHSDGTLDDAWYLSGRLTPNRVYTDQERMTTTPLSLATRVFEQITKK